MRSPLMPVVLLAWLLMLGASAMAQEAATAPEAAAAAAPAAAPAQATPVVEVDRREPVKRLGDIIEPVLIEGATAQRSFEWWSQVTRIPLVIDWEAMRTAGVDPDTRIDINLHHIPAGTVLALLIKRISTEETPVMYEVTPWYIEVLTKAQADKRVVMRTYDIRSLMMEIPNFRPDANFDLNEALSNTNETGSGSNRKLFGDNQATVTVVRKTDKERGEEIAATIRETIEPDIWEELKPGAPGSIRYFQGRLIVRAPLYVHRQIGLPDVSPSQRGGATSTDAATAPGQGDEGRSDQGRIPASAAKVDKPGSGNPVAAKRGESTPVAGVHD